MTLLLPEDDGIAEFVEGSLPAAVVERNGQAARDRLDDVTFYCLPYMGDVSTVALIREMPRLAVVQSLSSGVDDVLDAVPSQATPAMGSGWA